MKNKKGCSSIFIIASILFWTKKNSSSW